MNRIEALTFQVDALQKKYISELSRREAVRSSLAVPVAVLSFAAFGFVALSNTAIWLDQSLVTLVLSLAVVVLSIGSVCFLLLAISEVGRSDVTSSSPDANVLEFSETADEIESAYKDTGSTQEEAYELAIVLALEALSEEYAFCTTELQQENNQNLQKQKIILSQAVPGFGMLVLAIAISTGLKIFDEDRGRRNNGQSPATDAKILTCLQRDMSYKLICVGALD